MVEVAARKEDIKTRGGRVEFGPLGDRLVESSKGIPLGRDAGFVDNRAGFVAPEHLNVNVGKGVSPARANLTHSVVVSESLAVHINQAFSKSDEVFGTVGGASDMVQALKSIK